MQLSTNPYRIIPTLWFNYIQRVQHQIEFHAFILHVAYLEELKQHVEEMRGHIHHLDRLFRSLHWKIEKQLEKIQKS